MYIGVIVLHLQLGVKSYKRMLKVWGLRLLPPFFPWMAPLIPKSSGTGIPKQTESGACRADS